MHNQGSQQHVLISRYRNQTALQTSRIHSLYRFTPRSVSLPKQATMPQQTPNDSGPDSESIMDLIIQDVASDIGSTDATFNEQNVYISVLSFLLERPLRYPTQRALQSQEFLASELSLVVEARDRATDASESLAQEDGLSSTSRPLHVPQPRAHSRAAMLQNVRSRIDRALDRAWNTGETGSALPTRFAHPYDELLGFRLVNDETSSYIKSSLAGVHHGRFISEWDMNLVFRCRHSYITTEDRNLVEARQARALAGLTTQDMDREIGRRAQVDRGSWGLSRPITSYEKLMLTYRRLSRLACTLFARNTLEGRRDM